MAKGSDLTKVFDKTLVKHEPLNAVVSSNFSFARVN